MKTYQLISVRFRIAIAIATVFTCLNINLHAEEPYRIIAYNVENFFDAQHDSPAEFTHDEPLHKCSEDVARVHTAGRARCKPCLYHKSYLLEKNFSHLYLPVWTESPHRSFSCRLNLIMRDTERAMAISIMRKSTDVPP